MNTTLAAAHSTLWELTHIRDGKIVGEIIKCNKVPFQGINHILETVYNAGTPITSWYVGLFSNNHTAVDGDTGASIDGATIIEVTAYTYNANASNRGLIPFDTASGQATTNTTTVDLVFTGNVTVRGGFICSAVAKGTTGSGNGTLISCVNLGADRVVLTSDIIKITVTASATSA